MLSSDIIKRIAYNVSAKPEQVEKVIELFNSGCTIPFVSAYRKDITGRLDEQKLEAIAAENQAFIALEQRRASILANIEKAGRLTESLRIEIEACADKHGLEDLYLPFKKKRRTKAMVAHEQGLGPLSDRIWAQEQDAASIDDVAKDFIAPDKGLTSIEQVLEGARNILAERISEDFAARADLRDRMLNEGKIVSRSTKLSEGKKTKFNAYYEFSEALKKIPSHRFLAILKGVKQGLLRMDLELDDDAGLSALTERYLKPESPYAGEVRKAVEDAYRRLIRPSVESEVLSAARKQADDQAIAVFRDNARNLLMAPPAGKITVLGVDPLRADAAQIAVVDPAGTLLEHAMIATGGTDEKRSEADEALLGLIDRHAVEAIAIASHAGSREAHAFIKQCLQKSGPKAPMCVLVNDAGAAAYSASKLARDEFPDLDAAVRAAVSIARRLQDPLAELVKVEPRSVGVGQYQHDVNQKLLREGLHQTVVSCVNRVGVDLNTASIPLLRYVSGVQYGTAQNIAAYRDEKGPFISRQQLLEVPGVGPRVFEQCAAFLRISNGENVLDSTAIHPESYPAVEALAQSLEVTLKELVGNRELVEKLDFEKFEVENFGKNSLAAIREELIRPGRDRRKRFEAPKPFEGAKDIKELDKGTELEGVVTNVTDFGAFIDIGVLQDGLVHLSELANRFVRDPRQVIRVGEVVRVKVIEVDRELPRISLSIKALQAKPKRARRVRQEDAAKPKHTPQPSASDRTKRGGDGTRRADGDKRKVRKAAKGSKGPRPGAGKPKIHESGERSPLNTQLADQLEGLKEKLGS